MISPNIMSLAVCVFVLVCAHAPVCECVEIICMLLKILRKIPASFAVQFTRDLHLRVFSHMKRLVHLKKKNTLVCVCVCVGCVYFILFFVLDTVCLGQTWQSHPAPLPVKV